MSNRGRPSKYNDQIANEICSRLMGGESLKKICESEEMPDRVTVFRWQGAHEEFRNLYARAREEQADLFVEQMLEIADNVDEFNPFAINKARLQVDTRKWVAQKYRPKFYGDKIDISGIEQTKPIEKILVEVVSADTKAQDDEGTG